MGICQILWSAIDLDYALYHQPSINCNLCERIYYEQPH